MTDLLDGFLARVLNQRTKFGEILDPIADKVLVLAALVIMCDFSLIQHCWIF